jgi:hypothetical protein
MPRELWPTPAVTYLDGPRKPLADLRASDVPRGLDSDTVITLSAEAFTTVMGLIENPPQPSQRLREAAKRHMNSETYCRGG